jgi:leader peptidase (prepilin peptidase)/N-methyltransferase
MNILNNFSLFLTGVILGSFMNVIIYRLPRNQSIIMPGSHCTSCNSLLRWYENIPLLSYLILKGKCAHCGKPFSIRYPLVELLTGIAFVILFAFYQNLWHFIFLAINILLFIAIIFIDYEHYLIPDVLLVTLFISALIYTLLQESNQLLNKMTGALILGIILVIIRFSAHLIYKKEALGWGDVKLGALMGFLLKWDGALLAIFLGCCIASLLIIFLIVKKKVHRHSYIPLGPFMILGMLTYILWGAKIVEWYLNTFMK